jgi:AraC-like DNA-binding protein
MGAPPLHTDVRFWRDADLPGLEAREACYRREAFRTHTHAAYSVGLVRSGATRFFLNGRSCEAKAGQLVLISPGAPHACNPANGGMAYRMFYLAPRLLAQDGRLPAFAPVIDDPALYAAWDRLFDAIAGAAGRERKAALLAACLRELTSRHALPAAPEAGNPAVELACKRIAASHGAFVPLDELAAEAGLSRCHFVRVFKAATGMPPHRYQMQQAVEQAKALLACGAPISRAAQDAGFADQSHFSRCFREFTGATPGQYAAGGDETTPGQQ